MGRITSDLSLFEKIADSVSVTITAEESEETAKSMEYDFEQFSNVNITGIDISSLNEEELVVLYAQARYCQAMTDADIDTLRELVSEDRVFAHMSGMRQTREEYFADIADGSLNYFTIGTADTANRTFPSALGRHHSIPQGNGPASHCPHGRH